MPGQSESPILPPSSTLPIFYFNFQLHRPKGPDTWKYTPLGSKLALLAVRVGCATGLHWALSCVGNVATQVRYSLSANHYVMKLLFDMS